MPIKDPTIYPPYWRQFSIYIRKERAEDQCENCGLENGAIGWRQHGEWFYTEDYRIAKERGSGFYETTGFTKIVLTVAHLDHAGGPCRCKEETGRKCARPDHVLALCQACHLRLDLPKHIENRRVSLMESRDSRRTLFAEVLL